MQVVLTLIGRELLINRSYRAAFALDLAFGVLNVLMFYFISQQFGHRVPHHLSGAPSYFAFAAVGASVTIVAQSASAGVAAKVQEEQATGTLEILAAQPLTAAEVSLGLAAYPFAFGLLRVVTYLAAADLLVNADLSHASWPGALAALLLLGCALTALGIFIGAAGLVIKRSQFLAALLMFALMFGSGAFFPVALFPDWLRLASEVLPTRLALDSLRSALFQGSGWGGPALRLAAFSAVALPVAILAFDWSMRYAKRAGTVGQY